MGHCIAYDSVKHTIKVFQEIETNQTGDRLVHILNFEESMHGLSRKSHKTDLFKQMFVILKLK